MGLNPILALLKNGKSPVDSSFLMRLIIFIDIVTLLLEVADMSLTEVFAVIPEVDVKNSIVVD